MDNKIMGLILVALVLIVGFLALTGNTESAECVESGGSGLNQKERLGIAGWVKWRFLSMITLANITNTGKDSKKG